MTQYGVEEPRSFVESEGRARATLGQPRVIASGDHVAREDDLDEAKETTQGLKAKLGASERA